MAHRLFELKLERHIKNKRETKKMLHTLAPFSPAAPCSEQSLNHFNIAQNSPAQTIRNRRKFRTIANAINATTR